MIRIVDIPKEQEEFLARVGLVYSRHIDSNFIEWVLINPTNGHLLATWTTRVSDSVEVCAKELLLSVFEQGFHQGQRSIASIPTLEGELEKLKAFNESVNKHLVNPT